MTKVIVFLLKSIGSLLEVVGFENLEKCHKELMAGGGLIDKTYQYVIKFYSKRFEEILDRYMDKAEAKSIEKLLQRLEKIKSFFGFKEQKEKEEQKDKEQKDEKEQKDKKEQKDEKKQKKKGIILSIELYDIGKVDEILKTELWKVLKLKNVGAIKIEKKD